MFSDYLKDISWEQTTEAIYSKTDADVRARPRGRPLHGRRLHGARIARRGPLSRNHGAPEPPLYRGALRTHHLALHTALPHQLVHQLVRLLRVPHIEPHEAHHPHARGDRERVPRHKKIGPLREPAPGDGREPRAGGRRLHCPSSRHRQALLQQPQDRGHAAQGRGVRTADAPRPQRRDMLSGDLQPRPLQRLPPARHEVALRVACRRLRPHGAGRRPLDWSRRADRTRGLAYRRDDDGPPPALPAEALLAHKIQRQLPAHAPRRERGFPAQRHHERPRAGAGDLCHAYLRPRRRHIILDTRACQHPRQHGHAGRHYHVGREQDRPGRLLQLPAGTRTVPRERRAHRRRGRARPEAPGSRTPVWKDWDASFDLMRPQHTPRP